MDVKELPAHASLEHYENLAKDFVDADLAYGSSPALRARYAERAGSTTLGLVATSIQSSARGCADCSYGNVAGCRRGFTLILGGRAMYLRSP